ncbi:MAG: response regulator [Candidatus Korobacteraceae bacterium]|jgi:CheY-like chemotaxis protein
MADTRGVLILLVDDDVTGRSVRKLVLEANGHIVLATGEARPALRALTQEPVSPVILDYFLDGIMGTELARQMRLAKPNVPILLLSASADKPEGTEHVDAFLSKLEPTGVIEDKIAELLRRQSAGLKTQNAETRKDHEKQRPVPRVNRTQVPHKAAG